MVDVVGAALLAVYNVVELLEIERGNLSWRHDCIVMLEENAIGTNKTAAERAGASFLSLLMPTLPQQGGWPRLWSFVVPPGSLSLAEITAPPKYHDTTENRGA